MVLPKKGILSVASPPILPSGELGPSTATVLISFPPPTHPPLYNRGLRAVPFPRVFHRSRYKRHEGPPRDDPTTRRSAHTRACRPRAQFGPLDTHRISRHLRPALVTVRSGPVLSVATRGEVLAPLPGGHPLHLVLVWVGSWR